jgi:hypothetical protein
MSWTSIRTRGDHPGAAVTPHLKPKRHPSPGTKQGVRVRLIGDTPASKMMGNTAVLGSASRNCVAWRGGLMLVELSVAYV